MRPWRIPISSLLLTALAGCAAHAIPQSEIGEWMDRYYEATGIYADVPPPERFVHVAHRAGSPAKFARSLDGRNPDRQQPTDVVNLMDHCFGVLKMTAVEIDVQPSPLPNDRSVIVVHDRIRADRLSASGRRYMHDNTLRRTIEHFVKQGWPAQGRGILIELKAEYESKKRGQLDEETLEMISRITDTIADVVEGLPDPAPVRASIGFLGFSYHALDQLHANLGDGYRYYLTATSNQFPRWVFDWFTPLPRFDEAVVKQLATTPWITGTFFSPRWISKFVETFNAVNELRAARGLQHLEIIMAVYPESFDDYVERLKKATADGTVPLTHVTGLVYELSGGPPVSGTDSSDAGSTSSQPTPRG
jgi:hypothetical protein